jgi:hypothetical protein
MFADGDDIGGGFSFADMEAREATKFADSLRNLDSRMYTEIQPVEIVAKKSDNDERTMNYYSEGYEANYETVEDAEILQWQKSQFKFLCVTGQALSMAPVQGDASEKGRFSGSEVATVDPSRIYIEPADTVPHFADHQLENLAIVGKRMTISTGTIAMPSGYAHTGEGSEEEEMIMSHGILEDVIEFSAGHEDEAAAGEEGAAPSPETSVRTEVLASMVDTIWPDVVAAMKPLIHDVLVAAKENNIPYSVDQAPAKAKGGGGMDYGGGFGCASDDDDGGW